MERYVYSGSLTREMHDILKNMPGFEPLNILVTQVDRSGVKQAIEYKKEGFCKWFFLDSGAFSIHTGKAKTTLDEYASFINSIDEYIDVCAELDTIPGKFGVPKTHEDYVESAKKSWDAFLELRSKVKSPKKVMPVFHFGEDFSALRNMLEWKDENGDHLDYIGISPANDANQMEKNIYMGEVAEVISKSSNPDVKTHLYGMTSLDALSKYPCYSADSISHRLIAAYCKIFSEHFGVISITKKQRTSGHKNDLSFFETADDHNLNILRQEVEAVGLTFEQLQDNPSARVAFNMYNIQKVVGSGGKYEYKPTNLCRQKRLFSIDD